MRVIALEAENVKALRAVRITPTRAVTHIVGDNGAGKSSVLDCVYFALAGKKALPSTPVRNGAETAVIRLDLGDVKVTRRFSGNDRTEVIVEAASGARFPSPQRMLDDLLGELTFDPMRFALADPKAQLETLRGLVELDVDIDALDGANARDYELRRDWNRKSVSLAERVTLLARGVDPAMDTELVNIEALTAAMETASEHNAALTRVTAARQSMRGDIDRRRDLARQKRAEAERLMHEAEQLEAQVTSNEQALADAPPLADPIDVADLRQQLNDALKANALRERQEQQRRAHNAAVDELAIARAASQDLTAQMDERTREKAAAIARAAMPIPGLAFGEGEVLYHGVPFAQASTGEKIRVSFAIAMATNPKLRIALIRDGSLLDAKNVALIEQMAEAHDFQVFLERVSSADKMGILIQDGEVAAIDGVPVPVEVREPAEVGD